jgi:hypothetical protein
MKKRQNVFIIIGTITALAALLLVMLSTLAMAQQDQVVADAGKMMAQGWNQFNDGKKMIIQGVDMNSQIAVQQGVDSQMNPGNETTPPVGRLFSRAPNYSAKVSKPF